MIYEKFEDQVTFVTTCASWDEFNEWRAGWQAEHPKSELLVVQAVHYPAGGGVSRMPT